MSIPQREVDELYAKFDLHPNLIEIYVEGEFDYSFLNFYLEEIGAQSATVVCIDDINIDRETTTKQGFSAGSNKNRVLALSSLFDKRYGIRPTNVCCIADVDLDVVLSKSKKYHHSRYTDYSCMEMYFLNKFTINRFLQMACNLDAATCRDFFTLAELILPAQFALRAISESEKLFKATPEFEAGLKNKKDFNSFDPLLYCTSYIQLHSLGKQKDEIIKSFELACSALSKDIRHSANGHDFIHLLYEFAHKKSGLQLHNKEKSEVKYGGRIVALATNKDFLSNEKLFFDISNAVKSQSHLCP